MKRNKTALIAVIILGGASLWFLFHNGSGTIKPTLKDFAVEDTASITKIFLADKSGHTVSLERQSPGRWMVNGKYDVRRDAMLVLLNTIRKVDVKEPVGKNAVNNVIKRLAGKAVKCEIYQNNTLTKAYYVGTETQDALGTYMILIDPETMQTSAKPFITYIPGFEGYLTTRYFTEEAGWRDRTILHYNPSEIAGVKLEVPFKPELGYELKVNGNNNYEVKMLGTNAALGDIDVMAVKQYLSYFQHQNFESFEVNLVQKQKDSVMKAQPINILTITDTKGKTNRIKFFARKPKTEGLYDSGGNLIVYDLDRMDAVLNDEKELLMVQYFIFGKILPPANYFQKKGKGSTPMPIISKGKK